MRKQLIYALIAVGVMGLSGCSNKEKAVDDIAIDKIADSADVGVKTNKDIPLETLEDRDNTESKHTGSANILNVEGIDIDILDFVNDTSENKFLDYLCDNGSKMVIHKGLDETVEAIYTVKKEAEGSDKVLYKYSRPPYVYKSPEGEYNLEFETNTGLVYFMRKDSEGFQATFVAGILDGDTIGAQKYTLEDLKEDTKSKLESVFDRVEEESSGYICYSGDLEKDGYEISTRIQTNEGKTSYVEYRVTFANMGKEFQKAMEAVK